MSGVPVNISEEHPVNFHRVIKIRHYLKSRERGGN